MKTFQLQNGDLVLAGDRFAMVEGIARIQQQLGLGLREPYGSDRFHPGWGSMIPEWIGRAIQGNVQDEVKTEIVRVVRAHIMVQNSLLKKASSVGQKTPITMDEVIAEITEIRFRQDQDNLIVKVGLRTAGFQEFSILTSTAGAV